ncbi:MAG TPA: hypothetical protein VEB41_13015 [Burkholderiales bacterium]|nr:hypothetical protein [Burkholderiales bacterium]
MRRLAVVLVVSLAACAELPVLDPAGGGVDRSIADALAAARGTPAQQRAALERAEARFAREGSVASRLYLATLLAALPQPLRDDARAAQLLEPVADPASPGTGRFAAYLAVQLAERQRLGREVERLTRDAERALRERERGERERAAADKERDKREEALRQQLEALRAIERNILEREERLRRRAR